MKNPDTITENSTMANDETAALTIPGQELEGTKKPWCSFQPKTREDKARLYQALTNPENKISDCINKIIELKDILVEWVEMADQNGEIVEQPRCVLFDADGHTYAAVSRGLFNSLHRLCLVFGTPTWEEPIPVEVKQVQNGERRFYTLEVKM